MRYSSKAQLLSDIRAEYATRMIDESVLASHGAGRSGDVEWPGVRSRLEARPEKLEGAQSSYAARGFRWVLGV